MASGKAYLAYILDQLSELDGITYRPMMGEYLLYYQGRLAGGIYDNRLLVKPVRAARAFLPDAPMEAPYSGAKEMIVVETVDNRAFLSELFRALYNELPPPKQRRP